MKGSSEWIVKQVWNERIKFVLSRNKVTSVDWIQLIRLEHVIWTWGLVGKVGKVGETSVKWAVLISGCVQM